MSKRISSSNCSSDLAKKQKVTNDDEPQPQLHLMPINPSIPPEADPKKQRLKVYSPKDCALWPKIAVTIFRSQVKIHNVDYASDYMRYWYNEHQGLRTPPPKPSRSAYAIFFGEQKSVWFQTHGKWDNKKDGKKIGAMWKVWSDHDKQVYHTRFDLEKSQYNTNNIFWHTAAAEWRLEKVRRLEASGEEMDREKRIALKLNDICACELCKPKED